MRFVEATLVFLVREDQVLLAMKKRGFGKNNWNGVGGKIKSGESAKDCAIRETKEEIGIFVNPEDLQYVGLIEFIFPNLERFKGFNHRCQVYFAKKWQGEPKESEEMAPRWFNQDQLPYERMWDDDKHWLPEVLKGRRVEAKFFFDVQLRVDHFTIKDL